LGGIYTAVSFVGYDVATRRIWVAIYDDTYENAQLIPYQVDLVNETVTELTRITGLDGSLASPDLIHDNILFGTDAGWAGYIIRRYNGSALTVVDNTFNPPAAVRFVVPLPAVF
jgi:hypothetical protein